MVNGTTCKSFDDTYSSSDFAQLSLLDYATIYTRYTRQRCRIRNTSALHFEHCYQRLLSDVDVIIDQKLLINTDALAHQADQRQRSGI